MSSVHIAKDIRWGFEDQNPHLQIGSGWGTRVNVDPFPCYPHDRKLVTECLMKTVRSSWDVGVQVFIGHYENLGRSNAFAIENQHNYVEGKGYTKIEPTIFLQGKRIPPHPAVTRYLIAHEYGHCVQWFIERKLGLKQGELREPYRKLRKLKDVKHYGGGTWHKSPGEIFADDFRILICGAETEYWPHGDIKFPTSGSPVGKWWTSLKKADPDKWTELPRKGLPL